MKKTKRIFFFLICFLVTLLFPVNADSQVLQSDSQVQADAWITVQIIGGAPGMDEERMWNQDFGWTHTFDPTGKIIATVNLTIRAYDVRSDWNGRHIVYADGEELGYLLGNNNTWSETSFLIDRSLIYDDGQLNIWIDIDSLVLGFNTTVDWSRLRTRWDFASNPLGYASNSTGGVKEQFMDNETVYATGSGFPGSDYIDVYVVNDTNWGSDMAIPPHIVMKTVLTDHDGNLGPVEVWNPTLMLGDYDLVFDVYQDGLYKEFESARDTVDGVNITGFTVLTFPVGGELLSNNVLSVGSWFIIGISTIVITVGIAVNKKKLI
jgi:hypothetical protein